MKSIKFLLLLLIALPAAASAWQWSDLFQTPDQQGGKLLQSGKPEKAAHVFHDKNWQSVAYYRSGNYEQAFKQFSANKTSDGQYNAGNAAAYMGNYPEAIAAYDKAIALNSNNTDAITNREIVKKLLQQKQQQENKQQNKQQNKSASNTKNDKSKSAPQKNSQSNNQPQLTNNAKQNQPENSPQKSSKEQQNSKTQTAASNKQQRQDENNNQLLRRLQDDPGGLLQQKFARDYMRRHNTDDNLDQGVN